METFQKVMDVVREILVITTITVGFITVCFVAFCVNEVRKDKRR
jgi:multisubunit Na+/H+ antiporter MnhC subunit